MESTNNNNNNKTKNWGYGLIDIEVFNSDVATFGGLFQVTNDNIC